MDLKTVVHNLDNTIKGKLALRMTLESQDEAVSVIERTARSATSEFLRLNLIELNHIRDDLLEVMGNSRITETAGQTAAVEKSWEGSVDRQGGSFTDDEINNTGWR